MNVSPVETGGINSLPESSVQPPEPIDLEHLRRYTFGDKALEKEILGLFLMQLPETMGQLAAATNERDWKIAAHTLKGSSRAVGAARLADLAQAAENLASSQDRAAKDDSIRRLEAAAADARAFIENTYKGP